LSTLLENLDDLSRVKIAQDERKILFPLTQSHFIDTQTFQISERLCGNSRFCFVEKDAFSLVIGQRFSVLNDGDVVFFDLVKYPVLIAIGIYCAWPETALLAKCEDRVCQGTVA